MQKRTLMAVASAAVFLAGCSHNAAPKAMPEASNEMPPATEAPVNAEDPKAISAKVAVTMPAVITTEVVYNGSTLSSPMLTVKSGTKVSFKNTSASAIQLSRNPHPAHTGFKAFTGFDSGVVPAGGTYEYTFTVKGTMEYHNHFNPGVMGKVVVE